MVSFIIKLSMEQTKRLVNDGNISDIVILPMNPNFKDIVKEYLEDNTGFSKQPVVGLSRVLGEEGLEDTWDDLSNFISIKSGDVIIEFELPDDLIALVSHADFMQLNKTENLFSSELYNYFKIEEEVNDDNVIGVCPVLEKRFCKYFTVVTDNWQQDKVNPVEGKSLSTSSFFG